jgi:transposase-like protein
MGRRASGEQEAYWRGVIGRQKQSGLSIAEFCRREQISPASFYNWRRRLRGSMEERTPQFVPVALTPPSRADFEIRLPGGVSILAPDDFEEASLRRLLQVVVELERGDA